MFFQHGFFNTGRANHLLDHGDGVFDTFFVFNLCSIPNPIPVILSSCRIPAPF